MFTIVTLLLFVYRYYLITVILWGCKFKNKMYENNAEYKTKIACKYFILKTAHIISHDK